MATHLFHAPLPRERLPRAPWFGIALLLSMLVLLGLLALSFGVWLKSLRAFDRNTAWRLGWPHVEESTTLAPSVAAPPHIMLPPITLTHRGVSGRRSAAHADPSHGLNAVGRPILDVPLSAPLPGRVDEGRRHAERPVPWSVDDGDEPFTPNGILTPKVIASEIAARRGAITSAYVRELRGHESLAGRVDLRFTIGGDGAVRDVEVARDTVGDPALGAHVRDIVASWRFPAPLDGKDVRVIYPFEFRPMSE